jgi:histidine ammonia-lyase
MFSYLEDHGLPLIQLKEQRRDLVVALAGRGEIAARHIMEIAALQQTIAAIEAVISDLDAELDSKSHTPPRARSLSVVSRSCARLYDHSRF